MLAVEIGATDGETCELLQQVLGCGTVHHHARRQPHHDDSVRFQVSKLRDLVEVAVPFLDEHLPPSYKRQQYETWRDELLDDWEHRARRPRPCSVDGCLDPRRAKGLCRRHYYRAFGR